MVKYKDLIIGDLVTVDFIFGFPPYKQNIPKLYIGIVMDKPVKEIEIIYFNDRTNKLEKYALDPEHPHWNCEKI